MGLRLIHLLMMTALLVGCSITQPNPAPVIDPHRPSDDRRGGDALLQLGLKHYDDGQYKRAAATLKLALEQNLPPAKRVNAHKHLAFIYCISNRLPQCRSEFSKAIEVDPRFDLAPAEAGHPQWGPVFRNVKLLQATND